VYSGDEAAATETHIIQAKEGAGAGLRKSSLKDSNPSITTESNTQQSRYLPRKSFVKERGTSVELRDDDRVERLTEKPSWDFSTWSSQTEQKLRKRLEDVKSKLTNRITIEFGKMTQESAQKAELERQRKLAESMQALKEHNFYKAHESAVMHRNKIESYETTQFYEPLHDEYSSMMEMGNYPIFSNFSQPPSVTADIFSSNQF